ncbi:hypothetical protein DTO271G3_3040 [Paecilomyces variotii]|nr:hypothetical protein DTO271G3_3040 [Paecilomyces variotii]
METVLHIQGSTSSPLTPLFLIHAVSGLAFPYLTLGDLSPADMEPEKARPVYGISSPLYNSSSYRAPGSFEELARQYVSMIQEIQPAGPYLLGGWSMGGMIAVKMADLLQEQGETVLHVIMIDSANPEQYPAFVDNEEHDFIADMAYSAVAQKMNLPGSSHSDGMSSDSDQDDDADVELERMLLKMRKHIWESIGVISKTEPGQLLPGKCNTFVTLTKCIKLAPVVPAVRLERKNFIRKCFLHPTLRWRAKQFNHFRTILFNAEHDDVFDSKHAPELTHILRIVLSRI